MKVWNCGKFIDVELGQRFLVATCGGGHSIFGEYAVLDRITEQHLVFVTDSGTVVKTAKDNLHHVVGKAAKANYFVSASIERNDNFIVSRVHYWNDKKRCIEYK